MRKTLLALAVVTSVLLLQAPAWAPNLYITQVDPSGTGATREVTVGSDTCKNKVLTVTFKWGEKTAMKTAKKNNTYQYQATLNAVPTDADEVTKADVRRARCNGRVLPLTGAASANLLALGVSLLVIGALLVLSSRRRPLLRRG